MTPHRQNRTKKSKKDRAAAISKKTKNVELLEDRRMLAGTVAAFFVNGYGGEAIPVGTWNHLIDRQNELSSTTSAFNLDIFETNWNSPDPTTESGNPGDGTALLAAVASYLTGGVATTIIAGLLAVADPPTDDQFIDALADKLETDYDDDDVIILIGHSFGADSVLQVAQDLDGKREIDLLVTLDRVGTGGFRAQPDRGAVTSNVKYFYNRWQTNGPFPFDVGSSDNRSFANDGDIQQDFGIQDQKEQSISREADGDTRFHGCSAFDTLFGDCEVILVTPPLPDLPYTTSRSNNLQHGVFPNDDLIVAELNRIIDGLIPQPPILGVNIQPGTTVDEGTTLILDGSGTYDPNPGETITYQWSVRSSTGDLAALTTSNIANATSPTASLSLGDNGSVTLRFRATDSTGKSSFQDFTITSNNVAPTVTAVTNPPIGVRGHQIRVSTNFTDPGYLDTHEVRWDFGDGTVLPFAPTNDIAGLNIAPFHKYKANGTYTLTATVRDDDNGANSKSSTIEIRAVALIPRPNNPSIFDLQIGGTTSNDVILIEPGGMGGIDVTINGNFEGNYSPNGDVIIYAQEGNDSIFVTDDVGVPVKAFGDEDDDRIVLSNGAAVEFNGGSGKDTADLRNLNGQTVVLTNIGSVDGFNFTANAGTFLNIDELIGSSSGTDSIRGINQVATWTIVNNSYSSLGRTLEFSNFETLYGGSKEDTLRLVSLDPSPVMAFIGGAGTDEIVGPNAATDWQISQKNQGQVRGLNFEQVENLTGGTKVDTFEFLTNGSLSGKIEGLAGADILDFTALGAQDVRLSDIGSVDGFDGTTVGGTIGMGFANINAIAGSTSATTDKLTGIDATALWTIDSQTPSFTYQAKSRTLVFSNFEELTGGSKVDKFDVKATSFAMILNGEGDDDFFNFHSGDLDNYQGKVTIHGGADDNGQPDQRDRIYLDDQGGDNGEERFDYRLEPHSVTWLQTNFAPDRTFAGVYFDETMEFVRLDGTDGVNRFSVRPSEFTVFYVDGNEPGVEDCPPGGGDFLELDLAPLPPVDLNPVTGPKITFTEIVNGRQTKGVWTFDAPHKEVQFESIERFNLLDKLTVSDDAGFNSLPLIDVISPTTLTKYSDVVTNFSSEPLEAFSIFDYPVFQPGAMPASLERLDVNNDGMVSPKDLQILLDHLDEQPGQYDPRLDANRDGSVNVIDISSFLSAIIIEANKNHVVGGVRTTTADLNCDGLDEIIAVSGANLAPRIQVFNGVNGEPMSISQTIGDPSNTYGVYVSAGDFDGDGMVEIATSMERGSQAVTIWKWVDDHFEKVRSFDSGFDPNASGGVRVSTGDLNGDLTDEIIVSTGTGRNPGVSIFSGAGALLGVVQVDAAYGRGGITTTTGDLDGDGYDEILILAGRRGGSLLSYVPGSANIPANSTAILLGALYTGDDALSPLSGVTKDADGDGDDELFIGQLSDGRSSIVRKLEWNDAIDQFFDDGFFETDDEWTGDFLG